MAFTAEFLTTRQIREGGQFGTGDRTVEYRVGSIQVFGADRRTTQTWSISGGISAQEIHLAPLGASAPGIVLYLECSDAVDVRLQTAGDTVVLPAVRQLLMGARCSALFISTQSAVPATTVRVEAVGGANAQIVTTLPSS